MKLTTAYREKQVGVLTGTKHHYVACRVDFTNEERAIIQERGLYDGFIIVPPEMPPSTRTDDFLSMLMRGAGVVIAPLGLLFSCTQAMKPSVGGGPWPVIVLIVGVALFTVGKMKDIQANRRDKSPQQTLTFRRLLNNPDFVVHAYNLQEANILESQVRDTIANTAVFIRSNAITPNQKSYDF